MIQILKFISTMGQALMPLLNFELMGFALFMLAMVQNTTISIDPYDQETPQN